jgi:hypothetical protein
MPRLYTAGKAAVANAAWSRKLSVPAHEIVEEVEFEALHSEVDMTQSGNVEVGLSLSFGETVSLGACVR